MSTLPRHLQKHAPLRIEVIKQGAPIVRNGYIEAAGEEVAAITMILETTACEVCWVPSPEGMGILLWATRDSQYLNSDSPRGLATEILLPDFPNYRAFGGSDGPSRHNIFACLLKYDEEGRRG